MLHFECDYLEGAHPQILQKLIDTNMDKTPGYGFDSYCESAKEKIREACKCPDAEIHFLVGGTQTNSTVIKALLRPYEGVISADTGHINVHEAGAIESGGHKVLTLPNREGKLVASDIEKYLDTFYKDETNIHMVQPGMVYISQPTELGSLYSKKELEELSDLCKRHHLHFYIDGARLGYALMAEENDATLEDIAGCCDAFYIGGTKVGALFGEAIVFTKKGLIRNFFSSIKQNGVVLAKGRLLGIQFDTLFTDELYYKISKHAIDMAKKLTDGLEEAGCKFYYKSPTNQQFIILNNDTMNKLAEKVTFGFWETMSDTETAIRFCTNWATDENDVDELIATIKELL